MKIPYILLTIAVLSLGIFANAKPAFAASMPYDMGLLSAPDGGEIGTMWFETHTVRFDIIGSLEPNTMITFSYNDITITTNNIFAFGKYDNIDGLGSADASSDGDFTLDPAGLALASANITGGIATTTITNLSAGLLDFGSNFLGWSPSLFGFMEVSYNVSSVPLPAALPMFGLALIALRRFFSKKKEEVAA